MAVPSLLQLCISSLRTDRLQAAASGAALLQEGVVVPIFRGASAKELRLAERAAGGAVPALDAAWREALARDHRGQAATRGEGVREAYARLEAQRKARVAESASRLRARRAQECRRKEGSAIRVLPGATAPTKRRGKPTAHASVAKARAGGGARARLAAKLGAPARAAGRGIVAKPKGTALLAHARKQAADALGGSANRGSQLAYAGTAKAARPQMVSKSLLARAGFKAPVVAAAAKAKPPPSEASKSKTPAAKTKPAAAKRAKLVEAAFSF